MKSLKEDESASLLGFSETRVLDARGQKQFCNEGEIAQPLGMVDVQLLTVMEVARALAISRSRVYELMYKGELKSVKIGGSRRIRYSDLGEYVRYLDDAS
jgi:excisionase family DNA binding protein